MAGTLKKIADSSRFQNAILTVIVLNAITLGLGTYDTIEREIGGLLTTLDEIFLRIFVVELAIRIGAYGRRPWDFFRRPWNVFDFVVIGVAFAPVLREDVTLLRLARLLRVTRLFSVLPDLRILVRGMASSLRPIGTLTILALVVMYVFGMLGWILFSEGDPDHWGTIGDATLTLFVVMTLESWPDIMGEAMEITSWAWVYFVSYVLIASFLIINVVIAIIITAIEQAHREEREQAGAARTGGGAPIDATAVRARVADLRGSLERLETELREVEEAQRQPEHRRAGMASKGRLRP